MAERAFREFVELILNMNYLEMHNIGMQKHLE